MLMLDIVKDQNFIQYFYKRKNEKVMSDYLLKKIGLMLVTLSIVVCCNIQDKDQTKNQLEELQGQILVWVELPTESNKNPQDSKKISFEDSIEKFKELYPQSQVFVK